MATFPSDSVRTKNWGTEILTDADLEGQLDVIHDYIKAQLDGSTGHNHDGTSNQSKKLTSAAIGATFISGLTTVTGVSTDYMMIADASDSNAPKKALASDFTYTPTAANALSGSVIQTLNIETGAVATGSTLIPLDDTIPQNTEGDQYMSLAITPNHVDNLLKIDVTMLLSTDASATHHLIAALFQDSTADALASIIEARQTDGYANIVNFTHYMTAGTTSETTFKVRAGGHATNTFTFNGFASARKMGGVLASSITITEIKA